MFDIITYFSSHHQRDIDERIDLLSKEFLGMPYILGAQGEGEQGEFDQSPLFRFDGFDCVTYVNNVLALALSTNESEFLKKLLQINYYHSIPKYENRFHFMSVDWNPQNQKNKIVVDVTEKIAGKDIQYAEGEIDRLNWFLHRGFTHFAKGGRERSDRGDFKQIEKAFARIPYIPLTTLFDAQKNPIENIFHKIPHASIVEIVRPNWNVKDTIGTNLHISHLGFVVYHHDQLLFRHASSEAKCVVEVLLLDYLKNCLESPTIKGIHVQTIAK